jgi:SsrA-binding protein
MATKKSSKKQSKAILNRRASFDYELKDDIVVGLNLSGQEVRAARDGHVQLKGAFVTIRGDELWLNNASFSLKLNEKGANARTVDTSPRKILAHRSQINSLIEEKQSGKTIVPTKLLNQGRFIKLVIAVGKGKKLHDKRQTIKKRDEEREARKKLV